MIKTSKWLNVNTKFANVASPNPVVLFDMDETLVRNDKIYNLEMSGRSTKPTGDQKLVKGRVSWISTPRPGATALLDAVAAETPEVYVLTAAETRFANLVIEAHGWKDKFKGVFGRENFHKVVREPKMLLIDDNAPDHPNVAAKLDAMGQVKLQGTWQLARPSFQAKFKDATDKCYYEVDPFDGNREDKYLIAHRDAIIARIRSL